MELPQGEETYWVILRTEKGYIDFAERNYDTNITECYRASAAIRNFVENPEEVASYIIGESILTIDEDGRLTYQYEP